MANGFSEAPASWNTKYLRPDGFVCQLTLRGTDGAELLPKTDKVIEWLIVQMQIATGARRTATETARWEAEHPQECGCFLPSQSCPTCDAAARGVYGEVL